MVKDRAVGDERRKGRSTFPTFVSTLSVLAPSSLSLFSVRSVRLFQIDFRSDCHFYSPRPPHDPRLPKNAWYARLAPKEEKLVEHYFSLSLSLPSLSVGRLLISEQCWLPEMNHRSCVRACVRACGFSSRARIRAAYQELGIVAWSSRAGGPLRG